MNKKLALIIFSFIFFTAMNREEMLLFDGPKGCPNNSSCGEDYAKIYSDWSDIFLQDDAQKVQKSVEKFLSKTGIPLKFYFSENKTTPNTLAVWDSSCSLHQQQKMVIAEMFIKKLSDANEAFFSPLWVMEEKREKTLQKFFAPILTLPLDIKKNKLIFIAHNSKHHYVYAVDVKGKISFQKTFEVMNNPQEIKCPEILVQQFRAEPQLKNIYPSYYCKKIQGSNKKNYQLLIPWACP